MKKWTFPAIVLILLLNLHVFADIISGTVADSATGSALDSVRVSCGLAYVTYTASNGTFSLNTGTAVLHYAPVQIRSNAKIDYTVSNLQGRAVVQSSLNRPDFARIPPGGYIVSEKAKDEPQASYKVCNLFGTIAATSPGVDYRNRITAITAAAKADTVIFATAGYLSAQRITAGSQSGIIVKLQKASILSGMRYLPGGTFQMGSTNLGETPVHSVTVSAFYMDSTLVTQASYQALMGVNPSYFDTGATASRRPVEQVNWYDAVLYCNARSKHDGYDTVYSYSSIYSNTYGLCDTLAGVTIDYTKHGYRLPTEAEYEYAYRAGTTTDYYWGRNYPPTTRADTLAIDSNAVWYHDSPNETQPVATKKPNAFGLYDMAGNTWEWCNDWYGSYSATSQTDPTGPSTGTYRVLRGGSWGYGSVNALAYYLCAAYRYLDYPVSCDNGNGFRVVCGAR